MYTLDYVIITFVFLVGAAFALGALYLVFLMLMSAWRKIATLQMDITERRASLHKTQLVYPDVKGLLPVYAQSLQQIPTEKLLELYIERARLQSYPEFLQNLNIHTVNQTRNDNDLNMAQPAQNLITGSATVELIPSSDPGMKLLEVVSNEQN